METSALVTMLIGMTLIWGGLAVSILLAKRADRRRDPAER